VRGCDEDPLEDIVKADVIHPANQQSRGIPRGIMFLDAQVVGVFFRWHELQVQ